MNPPTWKTIQVKLSQLQEWEKNPVRISDHDAQQLAISMAKYRGVLPYVAAGPMVKGVYPLLDGHQRKKVEIQINKVSPDLKVDLRIPSRKLTEAERAEIVIRLRKNVGVFDEPLLLANFADFPLLDWGFTEKELKGIGFDAPPIADAEPQIEPDRYKEIQKKWKTKLGQLWEVGKHLIYCGDSLQSDSIRVLFNDKNPSLVIADPPYGVNIVAADGYVGGGESAKGMIPFGGRKGNVGGSAAHIAKTGMTYMESNKKRLRGSVGASKPFGSKEVRGTVGSAHLIEVGKYPIIIGDESTDTAREAVNIYRKVFPDCVHVWWGGNYYIDVLSPSMCWLVWNKETTGYFADCELAWTNQDRAARLFTHRWNGMLRDSEHERRWHPTQKPAALAEWVYTQFTDENSEIFDPFGGAGWSILGAELCNRKARVIEKSPEYVAVCLERMTLKFPGIEIKRLK